MHLVRSVHLLQYCWPCSFYITSGAKFGADFLAYPGDPMLFHAMYCVRVAPPHQCILPVLLAAAVRGSHAARKHLLLACVNHVSLSKSQSNRKVVLPVVFMFERLYGKALKHRSMCFLSRCYTLDWLIWHRIQWHFDEN